jgi:hypothetical protein
MVHAATAQHRLSRYGIELPSHVRAPIGEGEVISFFIPDDQDRLLESLALDVHSPPRLLELGDFIQSDGGPIPVIFPKIPVQGISLTDAG